MRAAAISSAVRRSPGIASQRGLQVGGGHPGVGEVAAVEPEGELAHGRVTPAADGGEDLPDRGEGFVAVVSVVVRARQRAGPGRRRRGGRVG